MNKFLIGKKEVKIQLSYMSVTPSTVARFTRPDQPPLKKLPAAGIRLDTASTVPPRIKKLMLSKHTHISH